MTIQDVVTFIQDAKDELTLNAIGRGIQEALSHEELDLLLEILNS